MLALPHHCCCQSHFAHILAHTYQLWLLLTDCCYLLLLYTTATYHAQTLSSYTDVSNIKCPHDTSSPLNPAITNNILRRVNWLLNNYYNPQLGVTNSCSGPVNGDDMQAAIWALTGEAWMCVSYVRSAQSLARPTAVAFLPCAAHACTRCAARWRSTVVVSYLFGTLPSHFAYSLSSATCF